MARSTFKVLFYVNGNKEKNDIVRIIGRVTINGIVTQFSYREYPENALGREREQGERQECGST